MGIGIATIFGDAGVSRVEWIGKGYLVTFRDRKVFVKENDASNPEDLEYALRVCRHFAQHGENRVVA